MNILRMDVSIVNKFLSNFKELFSNKQFKTVKMFIYAMLKDYKRVNISSLSKELPIDYQSLQYFFSDAKWDYNALNNRRINMLKKQRTASFTQGGILAIDDTGSVKPRSKKTEGVAYQYCPSVKGQAYCNVAVGSCFVKGSKHIPLNFKFYKTQDNFRLGKYDFEFKSKLDFAQELVDEAIEENINFSYVVFDSWYSSSDFIEFIDEKKHDFITEINSVRKVLFKDPVSRKMLWLQQNELVKLIKKHFRDKTKVVRYKDTLLTTYSFQTRLKECSVPVKAFVIFNKLSEDDSKSVRILITNDLKLSYKKVVDIYMPRRGIERAFQELKDTFYFDHYQVRSKERIMRYWMLCALVFTLIYWVKFNGCLSKVLTYSPASFNDYKHALYKLILFTSYAYLSKNSQESVAYFADIKSQRFKDKFLYH